MENKDSNTKKYLDLGGRSFILVGTAHVSGESVKEVEDAIESERPDTVAVELDEARLQNMDNPEAWKNLDVIEVLKKKQGFLMLANLVLAGYQKRMGEGAGVKPGDEMAAALRKARELGIRQTTVDRNIAVTLRRAWAKNSILGKSKLLSMLIATAFSKEEVSTTEIENLKNSNEMDTMLKELSTYLPKVKEVLIDERDFYLAAKIWKSEGNKILAVLGAGHLGGVVTHLEKFASGEENPDTESLEIVPKGSVVSKVILWSIPVIIVAAIVMGFVFGGAEKGRNLLGAWIIWNGALSGIGALLSAAHPLTILVAAAGAPLTSLCPLVGIGLFTGIVQAIVCKPKISDMENLAEDATSIKGFYRNRILKVLAVFLLSSLGSSLGTILSGANIFAMFMK